MRGRAGVVVRLAILAATIALAGCGGPAPSGDPSGAPSAEAMTPEAVNPYAGLMTYTCGHFPFGPEVLDMTSTDELAATPVAAALRAHLAQPGPDIDFLPDHRWILVGEDARGAEFVAVTAEDPGMVTVTVAHGEAGWKVSGWGQCQPERVLPDGLGIASWWFAGGQPPPGPDTQVFDAMVVERACASGRPADGRIVGPDVAGVNLLVLVTFAVRPLPGAQNCPSNPPSRVTIDLGEPLGNRTLLDAGTLPPREPVEP